MCGLVEPEECGQWAGEDGGLWGRGAGVLLDVGPFRWGSRLQAHLGLSLSICYPCFVTSDHKHSGSKHACFLSHSFCGQFSARGLSRMSSIWAVISSENQEPLPGHVVVGKMHLFMAAGGRSPYPGGLPAGSRSASHLVAPSIGSLLHGILQAGRSFLQHTALCREGGAHL